MKNKKLILCMILSLFIGLMQVNAKEASISVTSDKSTVIVGNYVNVYVKVSSKTPLSNWKFNLKYDSSILTLVSGETYVIDYVMNESTYSKTYTYQFKAKASGSSRIYVNSSEVNSWDDNSPTMTTTCYDVTVKTMTQSQLEATYSKDNYLNSLSVSGYTLNENFDKNKLEYSLQVENEVEKITIDATKSDSSARVNGIGTQSLKEGLNVLNITVIAENGNERVYKLNVTRKELNPIIVKINDKEYNIVRRKEELELPNKLFELSTITINNEEIPCFHNEHLKYNLVGLKNNEGKIEYYVYEDNNYTLYQQINFSNASFRPINKDINKSNYYKNQIVINNITIDAYKLSTNSRYSLIYGINLETYNEGIYMYDNLENTIQRYNEEEMLILNKQVKILNQRSKIFMLTTVLFIFILLLYLIYNLVNSKKTNI